MDDPGWAWPYWKFGLKKDDLFTKLHDQYNTVPSAIQDPEAFHHDVYEISHEATSTDDFHRLLTDRKQQRLRELNDSLESASLEIIANPSLIGTEQWQFALQLFRTKSMDSLVRYFASYLPHDHPWHHPSCGTSSISDSSSGDSITHSHDSFFEDEEGVVVVHEPLSISTSIHDDHLPLSPRSMTMCSDESADVAHHAYLLDNLTPARSLSFSESESERFALQDSRSHLHDDATSQPCDPGSPITSVSDMSDTPPFELLDGEELDVKFDDDDQPVPTDRIETQEEMDETETPTPKPEARGASFLDAKPSLPHRRHRSVSPSCPHPLSQMETHLAASHHDILKPPHAPRLRRMGFNPGKERRSRPRQPAARIRKPLPEPIHRPRPRGRKRVDG